MVAVTELIPAVWLVTLISTVPSGFVVIVEATVAPLSAITLTVCPASVLPNASVTLAPAACSPSRRLPPRYPPANDQIRDLRRPDIRNKRHVPAQAAAVDAGSTVLAPAVWLVTLISTIPSGSSVITVGATVCAVACCH